MAPFSCSRKGLQLAIVLAVLALCWFWIQDRRVDSSRRNSVVLLSKINSSLQLQPQWRRNVTNSEALRRSLKECCDAERLFAVTQHNAPLGSVLQFDLDRSTSHTVDAHTYSLFVKEPPLPRRLRSCAVVGNGGILKNSGCGQEIDRAQFIIRCNLPPLTTDFVQDSGKRTHIVTANPSIIDNRFKDLNGSKLLESLSVYDRSFIYMPAFSSSIGTEPSFWAAQTVANASANQTVLFAHPEFLRRVSAFWAARDVSAGRLTTGLFMVTLALSLCDQVDVYAFWPFSHGPDNKPLSHHYYDDAPPNSYHAMPQEFLQLWQLHKSGVLRMQLGNCRGAEHELSH